MKAKNVLTAVIACASLSMPASTAVASSAPPDPAPGGPQPPYEQDVEGTKNIDSLSVTATRGAGRSVTIAFDRRSRAETGQVPAAETARNIAPAESHVHGLLVTTVAHRLDAGRTGCHGKPTRAGIGVRSQLPDGERTDL